VQAFDFSDIVLSCIRVNMRMRPSTSKAIRHRGNSVAEARSREIQWKKAAFADMAGDNPEEEWPVGGRELWTPVLYFEQYFGSDIWHLIAEQTNIRAVQDNQGPLNETPTGIKNLWESTS
jgi:hypothetical protein